MSDERRLAETWDGCAAVISRAETQLAACVYDAQKPTTEVQLTEIRQCGSLIARDLVDTVPAVRGVIILMGRTPRTKSIGPAIAAGDTAFNGEAKDAIQPTSEANRQISEEYACTIQIWPDQEHETQPLSETANALAELLSNAAAKASLQDVLAFTNLRSQSENQPNRSLHQIAELLARHVRCDRLSLVDSQRRSVLASSEQPNVDQKSDLAIAIVRFALQPNAEEQAGRVLIDSFCDGRVLAVAEMLPHRIRSEEIQRERFQRETAEPLTGFPASTIDCCPPVFIACQASIADALARQKKTPVERVKTVLDISSWYQKTLAAMIAFLALGLIPLPIQVKARGRLVPVSQQRIFSSVHGEVESISCQAGQRVRRGELLCQLTSYELDSRETELRGELLTAKEQLQVAISNRGAANADIALQRQVLEVRVTSIQSQLNELIGRRERLTVRSSMDGIVEFLFDNESQSVSAGRPVQPGQAMFRVVDPEAGFHAELDIPDDQIGYVVAASRESGGELNCIFRIRSSPHVDHTGQMIRLADVARLGDGESMVIRATIKPDKIIQSEKSETGLLGWVRCKNASAGFVLFRSVIEAIRMRGG